MRGVGGVSLVSGVIGSHPAEGRLLALGLF